jgi:HlyD family secretion protein
MEQAGNKRQPRVLVLPDGDDSLREVTVETGLSNWKLTEITKGLKEGDKVVVTLDRKGVEAGALVTLE